MFAAELPEPPAGETLPDLWAEAGMVARIHGGGMAPLPWSELEAFARLSGHQLAPLALRTIRAMSVAYLEGLGDQNPLSILPSERG
jgi:hypothetical protein